MKEKIEAIIVNIKLNDNYTNIINDLHKLFIEEQIRMLEGLDKMDRMALLLHLETTISQLKDQLK